MSRLAHRLLRLEGAAGGDDAPLDFMLVFVSTDGTPDRMCRYVDGALVEIDDDKQEVGDGTGTPLRRIRAVTAAAPCRCNPS